MGRKEWVRSSAYLKGLASGSSAWQEEGGVCIQVGRLINVALGVGGSSLLVISVFSVTLIVSSIF